MLTVKLLLALGLLCPVQDTLQTQKQDSLLLMFWNLENFFDHRSENRPRYWTAGRLKAKCDAISKEIFRVADRYGRYPEFLAFAEVENDHVLRRLVSDTPLRKLGYSIVHYESPDHRGIDCALLYRKNGRKLTVSEPKHITDRNGITVPTRDILMACFDTLAILVNHHPSQIGGKTENRSLAMKRMNEVADSLMGSGMRAVIAVGDFNADYWGGDGKTGTIKYNGAWEKIDGHFKWGDVKTAEKIIDDPMLLEQDKNYGGMKPRRTFNGPRYNNGISDHLPIVVTIYF